MNSSKAKSRDTRSGEELNHTDTMTRSKALADRLLRDQSLLELIQSLGNEQHLVNLAGNDIHPASRIIASLFGLMESHQRPQGCDAKLAMAHIQTVVRLLQWVLKRSSQTSHHFMTKALTNRSLASIFFPTQTDNWSEMLEDCLVACLDSLALCELNRHVDAELVPYLDHTLNENFNCHQVIERDFGISIPCITSQLAAAGKSTWSGNLDFHGFEKDRWPVVYQWCRGADVVAIPSSLNCQRIDWKQIAELNNRLIKCLVNDLSTLQSLNEQGIKNAFQNEPACTKSDVAEFASSQTTLVLRKDAPQPVTKVANSSTRTACEDTLERTQGYLDQLHMDVLAEGPGCRTEVHGEIRAANDPQLSKLLERFVEQCRHEQSTISLLRVRAISTHSGLALPAYGAKLMDWHVQAYRSLKNGTSAPILIAFLHASGDLSLLVQDLDRTQITRLAREAILTQEFSVATSERTSENCSVSCGAATVSCPTRSFSFEQLASSAERCLQGALLQGRGAIKSLEVF